MSTALTIETVLEDETLRIRWLPGRTRAMVAVFTGHAHGFGAQPMDEFVTSASANGKNSVLFISDLTQSWYSLPGLWERIVRAIRGICRVEKIETLVSLGNSMGGYGALLLPRDLPVRRAMAFCPQVSMDPRVIRETRWPDAQVQHATLPARSIADTIAQTKTHYYLTAGRRAPRDLAQLSLMPTHKRVHTWVLERGGHNVAERLKQAGLLPHVIAAMIRGNVPQIETLYTEYHAQLDRAAVEKDLTS